MLPIIAISLVSGGSWEISTNLSSKVLTSLVEVVGVLFGLSAIMMALFFNALKEPGTKLRKMCLLLSATSFMSFILSLFMSFIYMLSLSNQLVRISAPIGFAINGSLCATLYMILVFVTREREKT